jgi:hypothetical protein
LNRFIYPTGTVARKLHLNQARSSYCKQAPRSITVMTFCFRVFRFDICMKRSPHYIRGVEYYNSKLSKVLVPPQDDFLACLAGTTDGRNWIIINYPILLSVPALRLCWSRVSQSVSLVGVQSHSSQFSNPFPFSTFFPSTLSTLNSHTNKIASNSSSGLTTLATDS